MIVHAWTGGGLANRLWIGAHLLAFGYQHAIKVSVLSLGEFAHLYPALANDPLIGTSGPRGSTAIPRIIRKTSFSGARIIAALANRSGLLRRFCKTLDLGWDEWLDLDDPSFVDLASSTPFVSLRGFLYLAQESLDRQADAIRSLFEPAGPIKDRAAHVLNQVDRNKGPLVGVHIRQGDYKAFYGGRFFFSTSEYLNAMQRLISIFEDSEITFVVVSDQLQDPHAFSELPVNVMVSTESAPVDLALLARCDYIVGPPSTFSLWSSFQGQVPIHLITDMSRPFGLSDFQIATSHFIAHSPMTKRAP